MAQGQAGIQDSTGGRSAKNINHLRHAQTSFLLNMVHNAGRDKAAHAPAIVEQGNQGRGAASMNQVRTP
jgi:hypothetical protein